MTGQRIEVSDVHVAVRVGPWPNSDSFPLQLAILPWYSDGLVRKSKFLSVKREIIVAGALLCRDRFVV